MELESLRLLLLERLGMPVSETGTALGWCVRDGVDVVWEQRLLQWGGTVFWLPCDRGVTPCVCYAEVYARAAARPEATYAFESLARGKPALRLVPETLDEVESVIGLIESLRSNADG